MKENKHKDAMPDSIQAKKSSFVAANGYRGFRSHFDDVYRTKQYEHLYIIKGGPGTGKSHAMSEIAKNAEKIGADCEYIYCSSDPQSLDGLILEKNGRRVGILDGTAPHTRCTEIPGAVDEIINLGQFWDSTKLSPHREKIFSLQQKKAEAYRRAYRYLRVAGEADAFLSEILDMCLLKDKMLRSITRLVRQIPSSAKPGVQVRYRQACSMRGLVTIPLFAQKTYCITDYLGSARFYLSFLQKELEANGRHFCIVYPSCYTDAVVDSILLPEHNILFTALCSENDHTINMKRFLDNEVLSRYRSQIRHLLHIREDMQAQACHTLKEAGVYHFALEELYGQAMNFAAKEDYITSLSGKIISLLVGS